MEQDKILKLENSIKNLEEKKCKIYLFAQDTKGNPRASIRYIYQLGMSLKKQGFNPIVLHEKSDYTGVAQWLGESYMTELTHKSIEGEKLEVTPEDFLIVPEIYGFVMEQVKDLPCAKIVLCQAYDHMLETLKPGFSWVNYGFFKCITTSDTQKEHISNIFRNISIDVIPPYIPETFGKSKYPAKPVIAIHTRDPRKTMNFIKTFYLKFPQYRWITFRDMRGLSEQDFATFLKDCFMSVWIDETGGYGTFPLESMKTGVPVIGKLPNLVPSWLSQENGIWVPEEIKLIDFAADFIQNWLEDNIKQDLYDRMEDTVFDLYDEERFNKKVEELFSGYINTRKDSFQEQLNKLKN